MYQIRTKTKELQDPHQEKNHNLKISSNSSNLTYFLPEPIKTTNYECALVEIKLPSIEFKEKKNILEIEFYNDRMGISENVQDVLDEIDKCITINDLKSKNNILQDPHKEKNHNLKISGNSSNFTYFLPEPIKTTNYECGLVEIKFPTIEFEEKKIMKLLKIEFYNDEMGISSNVQDVLDEIEKCLKLKNMKRIESIILKLDSKNYNLSLIGMDEEVHLFETIENLLKLLTKDKPETSNLIESVTNWELHKLFEEKKHENSKLIEIVKKWEDNVHDVSIKKELEFISTDLFNNSDLIDALTEFVSKNHQMIEFEMNSGRL